MSGAREPGRPMSALRLHWPTYQNPKKIPTRRIAAIAIRCPRVPVAPPFPTFRSSPVG